MLYLSSATLLGLAVVPAALRAYQLSSRDDNGWLELAVGVLRLLLVTAVVARGRGWRVRSAPSTWPWAQVRVDAAEASRTGWLRILITMTVVTSAALAFDVAVELLVDRSVRWSLSAARLDVAFTPPAVAAVHSAVKNLVVIPIYLIALLQATRVIPAGPARLPSLEPRQVR